MLERFESLDARGANCCFYEMKEGLSERQELGAIGLADCDRKRNGDGGRFNFCLASLTVWLHWRARNGGLRCAAASGTVFFPGQPRETQVSFGAEAVPVVRA